MKKQFLFAGAGVILVALLFIFGRTSEPFKPLQAKASPSFNSDFSIRQFIFNAKEKLAPSVVGHLTELENKISNEKKPVERLTAYDSLASFWKDSLRRFEPYAFYISEAAELDNSEKKLTFAAQLFLEGLRTEQDLSKINWETEKAIELFEMALKLNPENADLKIGLGSCYIFGKSNSGNPMKGIGILKAVADKDSDNLKAQMVLGVGGLMSGQYDKALPRFKRIVEKEPANLEAVAYLADTYAAKGEKEEAIRWYTLSKRLANNPHYTEEVDKRIRMLK